MTEINHSQTDKAKEFPEIKLAQISEDFTHIIDSDGQRVEFNDARVVYVNPEARNPYGSRLVIDSFKKFNRTIRISGETDKSVLQYSKKICSGRECLATVAIAGAVLKDIHENRKTDEITIYLWKRIPEEVLKKVPSLDDLKVEAMVFAFPSFEVPERDYFDLTVIHYVYCNYYKISDEWYLHAASWGGGFWEQDSEEWGHLVQDCKDQVEKFRENDG